APADAEGQPDDASPTIRSLVAATIEAGGDAAVVAGALPAIADDQLAPAIEVARPAKAEHGDFATNIASKRAPPAPAAAVGHRRGDRRSPRHDILRRGQPDRLGRGRGPGFHQPPPRR